MAKLNKSHSQLTKNVVSLTVVQIANYVLPLISVPIIVRIIGPDSYGKINFAVSFIAYFQLIISYSFEFTATRKIAKDPDNQAYRNEVFNDVFHTQCILFVIAAITFLGLLYTVPALSENKILFVFTFFICISTLFTQNWLFQAMQDLTKVAILNLVSKIIFTVSVLLVVREKEDYIWQPFLIGVIQISIAVFSFIWAFKLYNIKFLKISFNRIINVLNDGKAIFASLVFVNLYSYTSVVILGFYETPKNVGYFTAAERLILIVRSVLTMPLALAFYPFVGKAFAENREAGLRIVQKLIPFIFYSLGLVTIAMILLAPIFIPLFYGDKFLESISIFQTLAVIPLLFSLNNVLGIQIMMNLNMDKQFFLISAAAAVVSVCFNIAFIEKLGYMSTTFAWLITEIFLFVTMYFMLRRHNLNPINFNYFKLPFFLEYLQLLKARISRK